MAPDHHSFRSLFTTWASLALVAGFLATIPPSQAAATTPPPPEPHYVYDLGGGVYYGDLNPHGYADVIGAGGNLAYCNVNVQKYRDDLPRWKPVWWMACAYGYPGLQEPSSLIISLPLVAFGDFPNTNNGAQDLGAFCDIPAKYTCDRSTPGVLLATNLPTVPAGKQVVPLESSNPAPYVQNSTGEYVQEQLPNDANIRHGFAYTCTSCTTNTAGFPSVPPHRFAVGPPPPLNRTLTVSVEGTGSGTITSSPPGIDCPPTCETQFAQGATVTLEETPSAASTFTGWGGRCSGTGPCTVTMNAGRSVTATFSSCSSTFLPRCHGYSFDNHPADGLENWTSPGYADMASFYPDSGAYYTIFGVPTTGTIKGSAFYTLFKKVMDGGLCFGFGASSVFWFGAQEGDNPSGPIPTYSQFQDPGISSADSSAFIVNLIEKYHSRQLAELGFAEESSQYLATDNAGAFSQVEDSVATGAPITVAIVPEATPGSARWWQLVGASHLVVGYDTGHDGVGNDIINIYDPNAPGDDQATLDISKSDDGVTLESSGVLWHGGGTTGGTDYGSPDEWRILALPDFTWQDDSSVSVALAGIPIETYNNRHWLIDAFDLNFPFFIGATSDSVPQFPALVADAAGGTPASIGGQQGARPLSGKITASEVGAEAGMFSGQHVVTVTQTDPGAAGATHRMMIDPSATSVSLSDASSEQTFDVMLGADYLPTYGRSFTIGGTRLGPSSILSVSTDGPTETLAIEGTGTSQELPVTISQHGLNASSATVVALLSGSGSKATIGVFDWNDLAGSLVYETYATGGHTKVIILQDNPTQRRSLQQDLFVKLFGTISQIPHTGIANSLQAKATAAQQKTVGGDTVAAANLLAALDNEVRAQTGKDISGTQADAIVTIADTIAGLLKSP